LKHGAELADFAQSLQSKQFDESLRETGRQRHEDLGPTAKLDQAVPGRHFAASLFVDIFLQMAHSYPIPQELGGRSVASGAALKVRELRLCYEQAGYLNSALIYLNRNLFSHTAKKSAKSSPTLSLCRTIRFWPQNRSIMAPAMQA
jgi:hypothetical protein